MTYAPRLFAAMAAIMLTVVTMQTVTDTSPASAAIVAAPILA